jgi:tetratricopeptide (TPR) repeat protein
MLRLSAVAVLALTFSACARPGPNEQEKQAAARKAALGSVGELAAIVAAVPVGKSETGVELRASAGGAFAPARAGSTLPAGSTLRTAAGVQVRLTLRDGSSLHLNERSELSLAAPRQLSLAAGELLAEVAPAAGKPLDLATGAGTVRVTGTKLNVKVDPAGGTVVDVARGTVEVSASKGGDARVEVGAGERAVLRSGEAPRVSLSRDLAEATRWARELGTIPASAESLQPGIGSLEARAPGGGGRGQPLRLARQTVRVTVQDNVARTEIEQEYYNPTGQTLEGTYRFPIPAAASISRLALYVGNRLEEGEIVERQRARQIFRQIVEDTVRPRDPALLEWVGGRTFQMKIFPIPPRASRRVILGYTQPLAASYGRYRYEYPLASAPGKATAVGRFALELKVRSSLGEVDVSTPLYPTLAETKGDARELRFEASDFRPAASFVATIAPKREPAELTFALFEPEASRRAGACLSSSTVAGAEAQAVPMMRDRASSRPPAPSCGDRGGFFMATLRPELPRGERAKPQDVLFLLDSSYSTGKRGWALATAALEAFLAELDLRARFDVLACDTRCRALASAPRHPTAEARKEALAFARGIVPSGSSHLAGAFAEAAARISARKGESPTQVIYIGDGRPSAGELREAELARLVVRKLSAAGAGLTALQIGDDAGELFLGEATRRLGGAVHHLDAGDDVGSRVFELVAAQYRPTLSDLELSFEGLDVHHVYPARLEALSAGSEAVIVGRYDVGGQGAIKLRGKLAGKPFERRFPLALAALDAEKRANSFIPRLWAKHHLDALSAEGHGQNRAEIVRVSKAYTVLSKATAFLVLENEKMYREFGVKRRKDRSDWKGDALASRTGRDTPETTAPPAPTDKSEQAPAAQGSGAAPGALGSAGGGKAGPAPAAPAAEPSLAASKAKDESRRGERASADDDALADPAPEAKPTPAPRPKADAVAPPAKKARSAARESTAPPPPPRMTRRLGHGYYRRPQPVLQTTIEPLLGAAPMTAAARRLAETLRAQVEASPLKRSLHLAYQRALLRGGDYGEALRHAQKWVELDGAHADALAALGVAQAARGELAVAMQSLASTVDVEPWNARRHEQLAAMYRHKAEPALACAHLESLASLAPRDVARALAAATCLSTLEGGSGREAAVELLTALAAEKLAPRELGLVARALASARAGALRPGGPESEPRIAGPLVVHASWTAPVDLDLALVTPRGQRLSSLATLRAGGVVRDSRTGSGSESLRLASLPNGEYRIEIGRARSEASAADVSGTLLVQAGGKRQTIAFSLGAESPRAVARLKVERLYPLYRY